MGRKPTKRTGKSPWPERLKKFRLDLGHAEVRRITQREAAARLGVTRQAWINWEVNGKVPSPAYAKLLNQFIRHPEDFPAPD